MRPQDQSRALNRPLWVALIVALAAALGCNLTAYRPTPIPPTVGVGSFVNPHVRAGLSGVTAVQVQVREESGAYRSAGTITGSNLDTLLVALNVSVRTSARAADCPDHLRLTFVRQDASQTMLTACLDGVVRLRGLPGAEALDVPMYGATSDALSPYLPAELQALLTF